MISQRSAPSTIGYLQVGPPEHGICRYGRLLASAARRRRDLVVIERNVVLTGHVWEDRRILRAAANDLSHAHVVHLQVSVWGDGSWGRTWHALSNLRAFRRHCRAPLVATIHDVNSLAPLGCAPPLRILGRGLWETANAALRPGVRLFKQLSRGQLNPPALFRELWSVDPSYPCLLAHEVARLARVLFVLTESERALLQSLGMARRSVLIPHFVEDVPVSRRASTAAEAGRRTVLVAGFIFRSKGHGIILAAMPLIPDVKVVFLGGPSLGSDASDHSTRVMDLARQNGVDDRLEVTGYLPDDEYHHRISTADLAVCPFSEDKSASSSLATLIATGCPILASDIPPIAEYNAIVPGAISTFSPYTPEALATAIRTLLATPRLELTEPLSILRERLSISTIYDRHVTAYRRALQSESPDRIEIS